MNGPAGRHVIRGRERGCAEKAAALAWRTLRLVRVRSGCFIAGVAVKRPSAVIVKPKQGLRVTAMIGCEAMGGGGRFIGEGDGEGGRDAAKRIENGDDECRP